MLILFIFTGPFQEEEHKPPHNINPAMCEIFSYQFGEWTLSYAQLTFLR